MGVRRVLVVIHYAQIIGYWDAGAVVETPGLLGAVVLLVFRDAECLIRVWRPPALPILRLVHFAIARIALIRRPGAQVH